MMLSQHEETAIKVSSSCKRRISSLPFLRVRTTVSTGIANVSSTGSWRLETRRLGARLGFRRLGSKVRFQARSTARVVLAASDLSALVTRDEAIVDLDGIDQLG